MHTPASDNTGLPHSRCRKCGSPACLALVRADTPPANLIDLIDRQFKLMSSGHWSWDHVGYFAVVVVIAVIALYLCAAASPSWALAVGGGGLATTVVGSRWLRRRRQQGQANDLTAPSGDTEIH
ncbi:hypothetical protein [Nocardia salmonicida]|uniref:hypothetical protein n=1 Tax=Nocardia salmonicida TaxID=53431 RepID=UPI002E2B8BCE|nr:hypothetical protein [Nocardia salmonicida]